jgi:glycerophosphoryl diester phosphodiesterase
MESLRICAHRGLSQACPENTLPAFAAAIAVGPHEIEFDVRTTRDGVLVVCHDATVDRTTDGTGKVADLSWHEIRHLDAGIHVGAAWRSIRMPRLEEVLDIADGHEDGRAYLQKCIDVLLTNCAHIMIDELALLDIC